MADINYENIRLVLGEPNPGLRQSLKQALFTKGFRGIADCHDLAAVSDCLEANACDVLICDIALSGDFCQLVHRLRHHRLGNNPFVLTIATTDDASAAKIRQIIDSGVDDLLAKPVSLQQVLSRVDALARSRKPFVVTHDYIGPDRRKAMREGERSAEQFEVPNPLRSKALGGDSTSLQRTIENAALRLNIRKMERYAEQIGYLVDRVLAQYEFGGNGYGGCAEDLDRLLYVGEDLSRRLRGTQFAFVGEMAMSLVSLVQRFRDPGFVPDNRDGELLTKLSDAIRRAFNLDQSAATATAAAVEEISGAVNRFAAEG